jgi:DNA-binding GntR family transcriptional regulator
VTAARVGAEETAYRELHRAIVGGDLLPGARLVEADLVALLGASRTVVRAALARLQYEGLVVREPHRGARVRLVTVGEAVEIVECRAAIETLAVRHAATRATDADIAELRGIHAEMTERIADGDLLGYSDCNARFHARILDASQHRAAQRLVAGLRAQIVRFQFRTVLVAGRPQRSLAEHGLILSAIAERDAAAAAAAMAAHLAHVVENLPHTETAQARSRLNQA